MKSQKSRADVFNCIDKMIKSKEKLPDSDLNLIIEAIDDVLFHEKENVETESKKREVKIEKWGNTIESVGDKISKFCVNNVDIAVEVLDTIGECHWVAVGFVLVASVLKKWDRVKHNKKECLRLLKSMNDLAKVVLELRPLPHETANTQAKIKESIHTILKGAMSCSKMMDRNCIDGLVKSVSDKDELLEVHQEIDDLRSILHVHISVCIFKQICEYSKECGVTKQSATSEQNEEVLNEKPQGNDTFILAEQTPRDDSKKRRRSQDSSESSYSPDTPICKREKFQNPRTGIEGNTG